MRKEFVVKKRGLFDPNSNKPFKISRSQIEAFCECPRCFWLNHRMGIRRPSSPPFLINTLVDKMLKVEFDACRNAGKPHPLMIENGIDAVPMWHPELDSWRNNFQGMQYLHQPTNLLVTGAIDDLWQKPCGEAIVVDYKATAKKDGVSLNDDWQISYKRQMEIYQWLTRMQGLTVSDTGYFVYCNGQDSNGFNQRINFAVSLVPYTGNNAWLDSTLADLKACLLSDVEPTAPVDCEFCGYVRARQDSAKSAQPGITKRGGVQKKPPPRGTVLEPLALI
jgi:hypothetical protein